MTDHKVSVHVSPCSLQIRRGGSATYTIKVNRPPTTGTALNIQIEPQCPDGSVEVLPNRVQFSHLNWRVSQTVRVEATTKSRLHCVNIKHRIVRSSDRIYPVNLEIPTVFALFLQKDAVFYYSFGAGTTGCLSDPAMRCRYEPYLSHYTWLYPIHVACGDAHVAFVDVNGQVYCIGQASQLGQGKKCATSHTPVLVESISTHSVTHIACGDTHTICTTSMGCVYGWGSNSQFQLGLERSQAEILEPRLISHELNAATVAAAANHSFLLTQHGQLYSTGQNMAGQLGHGDTKPRKVMTLVESFQKHRVYSVSCGPYHTAALSNDVFTWGDGEHGRLGTGNLNLQRVPTVVPTLRNQKISQLVCGGAHTAAITSKHEVYTWGANTYGQLGHGTFTASKFPRRVRLLTGKKIQSIALGTWHSVALAKGGDVYSWGFGGEGQLGLGHDESVTLPMIIADVAGKGALSISCGAHFSIVTTAFREKNRKLETIQRRVSNIHLVWILTLILTLEICS